MSELTRRDALERIVGAGAAAAGAVLATAAAGCGKGSRAEEGNVETATTAAAVKDPPGAPAQGPGLEGAGAVLSVEPLSRPWQTLDPFVFCMHHDDRYPAGNDVLGPAASLDGREIGQDFGGRDGWSMYHGRRVPGFPQHPHRGFETVTIVRSGLVDHSDSLGAAARYGGGDVQWLTAGRGILHAEMFPLLDAKGPNRLELFQLWLNLPAADKMVEPHFSMLWGPSIPHTTTKDEAGRATEVAVVAGRWGDLSAPPPPPKSWASRPESDVAIWTLRMEPGARALLPPGAAGSNRALYLFRGTSLAAGGRAVPAYHRAVLRADLAVTLEAGPDETEALVLQGRPIGEPVSKYGPFVMNTRSEIEQAFADFRRTRFGGWPWPSDEPVHPKEEGHFARHADGRIERRA